MYFSYWWVFMLVNAQVAIAQVVVFSNPWSIVHKRTLFFCVPVNSSETCESMLISSSAQTHLVFVLTTIFPGVTSVRRSPEVFFGNFILQARVFNGTWEHRCYRADVISTRELCKNNCSVCENASPYRKSHPRSETEHNTKLTGIFPSIRWNIPLNGSESADHHILVFCIVVLYQVKSNSWLCSVHI